MYGFKAEVQCLTSTPNTFIIFFLKKCLEAAQTQQRFVVDGYVVQKKIKPVKLRSLFNFFFGTLLPSTRCFSLRRLYVMLVKKRSPASCFMTRGRLVHSRVGVGVGVGYRMVITTDSQIYQTFEPTKYTYQAAATRTAVWNKWHKNVQQMVPD